MSPVLLVARCGGTRCAALNRMHGSDHEDVVAESLRRRRDGVLMSTDCLGRCHVGAVAVVGWASGDRQRLAWQEIPLVVEQVDGRLAACSLAAWIEQAGHPATASMPGEPGASTPER